MVEGLRSFDDVDLADVFRRGLVMRSVPRVLHRPYTAALRCRRLLRRNRTTIRPRGGFGAQAAALAFARMRRREGDDEDLSRRAARALRHVELGELFSQKTSS